MLSDDLRVREHLGDVLALVQQPIALTELADDLLGRMPVSLHRGVLLPSMLGDGLPHQVDHYPGPRSGLLAQPVRYQGRCFDVREPATGFALGREG